MFGNRDQIIPASSGCPNTATGGFFRHRFRPPGVACPASRGFDPETGNVDSPNIEIYDMK
jgi:hypothetical protein